MLVVDENDEDDELVRRGEEWETSDALCLVSDIDKACHFYRVLFPCRTFGTWKCGGGGVWFVRKEDVACPC